jgi:hypothetical protein
MKKTEQIDIKILRDLYEGGLSMKKMAQKIGCSEHKITYWMKKYDIERRSRSAALYLYSNPFGDPFKIKQKLTPKESVLYGLGLGIYWGEGEKVSKYQLRVANTNPGVIRTFVDFLLIICQLSSHKISYHLICFNDTDINESALYWSKELEIPREKFGKIVQISPQGKGTYRKKSKFGVCTVIVSNIKLKEWIMKELSNLEYADMAQW